MDTSTRLTMGKLIRMPFREFWTHEATHFSPWLAEQANLALLGNEIGFELELLETESNFGRFRVDILATVAGTDHRVIIENQLEPTDHSHLGQILTYAAGCDAKVIIWVAERVLDEHRAEIDWLNTHTHEDINFFLVEVSLWRIDASACAPRFEVIASPNDWQRVTRSAVRNTELEVLQQQFWQGFNDYAAKQEAQFKPRKASAGQYH